MAKDYTDEILHVLRNPYGYTETQIREVMFDAADEIERWKGAFENMRDWAIENGLDVTTRNVPDTPPAIEGDRGKK